MRDALSWRRPRALTISVDLRALIRAKILSSINQSLALPGHQPPTAGDRRPAALVARIHAICFGLFCANVKAA